MCASTSSQGCIDVHVVGHLLVPKVHDFLNMWDGFFQKKTEKGDVCSHANVAFALSIE